MTKDEALKLALKFVEDSECGTADLETHIKEALAQHTWVGLTDQEIEDALYDGFAFGLDNGNVSNQTVIRHVIRVIEAKLKEKNT